MAQNATIYRAELHIADMDRHYYSDHTLTVARHPSETDERMMVRLLAFALHASDTLAFTKGLSTEDEPDLWRKDLTGAIELWIELGQPDARRVRKACARAKEVFVYHYASRTADSWWKDVAAEPERIRNFTAIFVPSSATQALAALAQRNMQLQCAIQEGQAWIADDKRSAQVEWVSRKAFDEI